ncbi:MAG: UDP-3-O-(3-hydroxymyristoyl)glucosamine N-acyltransferase [Gammaproteobacteria bacterium]
MVTLGQLAAYIGGELSVIERNSEIPDLIIDQVATLDNAQEGQIAFLFDRKYRKFLKITHASAVVLQEQDLEGCQVPGIVTKDPYLAYAKIASLLNKPSEVKGSIHTSAVVSKKSKVDPSAQIGPNVVIEDNVIIGSKVLVGPGCVVSEGALIGDYSRLMANVSVCHHVTIGKRVLVHPGAVLGADGFGLARENGAWLKIPQIGSLSIGDDVEIGANTTIDRGAMKDTIIERGVKIDNQVQIAHNVHLGENTAIAGCVGIAGSAKVGKRCMIGGGAGIIGHLEIADDVTVRAMSMVTKSIKEAGDYSSAWSVRESKAWRKTVAKVHRLDKIKK